MKELIEAIETSLLAVPSMEAAFSVSIADEGKISVIMNNEDSEEAVIVAFIKTYYERALTSNVIGHYSIHVEEFRDDEVKEITFQLH